MNNDEFPALWYNFKLNVCKHKNNTSTWILCSFLSLRRFLYLFFFLLIELFYVCFTGNICWPFHRQGGESSSVGPPVGLTREVRSQKSGLHTWAAWLGSRVPSGWMHPLLEFGIDSFHRRGNPKVLLSATVNFPPLFFYIFTFGLSSKFT